MNTLWRRLGAELKEVLGEDIGNDILLNITKRKGTEEANLQTLMLVCRLVNVDGKGMVKFIGDHVIESGEVVEVTSNVEYYRDTKLATPTQIQYLRYKELNQIK